MAVVVCESAVLGNDDLTPEAVEREMTGGSPHCNFENFGQS